MELRTEKLWLIDQIVKVQDANLLQRITNLFEQRAIMQAEEHTDFWSQLSLAQQQQVECSIKSLDEGQGIPHSNVIQEFRQKYIR